MGSGVTDEKDSLMRFMLRDPVRGYTMILGLGGIIDLFDEQVGLYREQTKCFHHVRAFINIDYKTQEFDVKFECDECSRANKTREVLT